MSLYVPFFAPRPSIVTIHDLIHLRFPEYFKAKVGPYYQTVVRRACARAARVITDDERTIDDLQRFLGVDPAKVRVVPLGVDERFFTPAAQPPPERPYLLYVGNHRPHKDLATLLGAWAQLDERFAVDLYLTGPDDFGGALDALQSPDRRVRVLGDVPVDRLIGYYAGARALVQPALCEGFGLPILEAMAAGTAVVACQDAVPAVVREAALTFAPRDVAGLRAHLERLLDDEGLRASLINLGRKQAQPLTWDRCARSTADIYREVVS
jgi:glycosyltransferase involved in cell wall biosynthesis